jgi:hypothetical protein
LIFGAKLSIYLYLSNIVLAQVSLYSLNFARSNIYPFKNIGFYQYLDLLSKLLINASPTLNPNLSNSDVNKATETLGPTLYSPQQLK